MDSNKEYVLEMMRRCKDDTLEKAEYFFKGISEEQLDFQRDQSGKTMREVLEGFREERRKWENAFAWLQKVAE